MRFSLPNAKIGTFIAEALITHLKQIGLVTEKSAGGNVPIKRKT